MAETPSEIRLQSEPDLESHQYWCYSCDKRVPVEILADLHDIVCFECKNGFVESISAGAGQAPDDGRAISDPIDDLNIRNQFMRVLHLLSQTAREEGAPPTPPSDRRDGDDLWVELDGWDNDDDEDEDERSVEVPNDEDILNRARDVENRDVLVVEDAEGEVEAVAVRGGEEGEEEARRRRRDELRLRLREFASRAASRRNRILDWAEIFIGLEDNSVDLRLQVPESDTYIGNPGDYVDAAGYAALLQNLAESDSGGRRGAPPAAKRAIEGLGSSVIVKENEAFLCAICKDLASVGEIVKKLPCGHGYHGECIVTWLGSRNSCPVCRFELPTDDPDYEEERKKRVVMAGLMTESSSSSGDGGFD